MARAHSPLLKVFIYLLVFMIIFSAVSVMVLYLNVPTQQNPNPVDTPEKMITLPTTTGTIPTPAELNSGEAELNSGTQEVITSGTALDNEALANKSGDVATGTTISGTTL